MLIAAASTVHSGITGAVTWSRSPISKTTSSSGGFECEIADIATLHQTMEFCLCTCEPIKKFRHINPFTHEEIWDFMLACRMAIANEIDRSVIV